MGGGGHLLVLVYIYVSLSAFFPFSFYGVLEVGGGGVSLVYSLHRKKHFIFAVRAILFLNTIMKNDCNWPLFPPTAPDFTTTPPPCEDVLPNCENYGDDVCSNVAYADWALSNCRKFCNLCGECFSGVFAYLNVCNNNNHDNVNFWVLISPSWST